MVQIVFYLQALLESAVVEPPYLSGPAWHWNSGNANQVHELIPKTIENRSLRKKCETGELMGTTVAIKDSPEKMMEVFLWYGVDGPKGMGSSDFDPETHQGLIERSIARAKIYLVVPSILGVCFQRSKWVWYLEKLSEFLQMILIRVFELYTKLRVFSLGDASVGINKSKPIARGFIAKIGERVFVDMNSKGIWRNALVPQCDSNDLGPYMKHLRYHEDFHAAKVKSCNFLILLLRELVWISVHGFPSSCFGHYSIEKMYCNT